MKSFIFYISMFGFQKIFHRRNVSRILILISIYNRNMKNMIFFFNFWQEQVLIPFIFSIFHTHFYLIMQMYRMILVTENDQIKINDFWRNDRCKIKKKKKRKIKNFRPDEHVNFNHAFVYTISTNHSVYPTKPWEHTLKTRNKRCALIVQQMRSVFHCHG